MARRSNRSNQAPTRYPYSIARPRLFGPVRLTSYGVPLGDRRTFYPEAYRPADYSGLRLNRSLVEKRIGKPASYFDVQRLAFRFPDMVHLCVRRKVRREVLFAMDRTGRGSSRARKRRNEHSEVSCK